MKKAHITVGIHQFLYYTNERMDNGKSNANSTVLLILKAGQESLFSQHYLTLIYSDNWCIHWWFHTSKRNIFRPLKACRASTLQLRILCCVHGHNHCSNKTQLEFFGFSKQWEGARGMRHETSQAGTTRRFHRFHSARRWGNQLVL